MYVYKRKQKYFTEYKVLMKARSYAKADQNPKHTTQDASN